MKFCKKAYNFFFFFSLNYLISKNFGSIKSPILDGIKQEQYEKQESLDKSTVNSKNIDQSLTDHDVSTKDESPDNHSDQSIDDQGKSVESSSITISPSAKQSQGPFNRFRRAFSESLSKAKDHLNKAGNFVVNNKNISLLTQKISHSDFYKITQANINKTKALIAENPKTASALGVGTIGGVTVSVVHSKRKQKRILKEFENAMVKSPEQKDKIIQSAIENKKQQLENFNDLNILLHHIGQGTPVKPNDILLQDQCQWKHNWSFLKGYLNDSIETIDGQNYQVRLAKKTIAMENVVSLMAATYETEITKYLDDLMKNSEAVKIIGDHQQQTESFKQSVDSIQLTLSSNGQNSGSNQKPNAPNPLNTPSQQTQNAPSSSQQIPGADATTTSTQNPGVGTTTHSQPSKVADAKQSLGATTTSTPGGADANTTSKPKQNAGGGAGTNASSGQKPNAPDPSQQIPVAGSPSQQSQKAASSSQQIPGAETHSQPSHNAGGGGGPTTHSQKKNSIPSTPVNTNTNGVNGPKQDFSGFAQQQTARFASQNKQSSKVESVKPINNSSNQSSSISRLNGNSEFVNFNISSNQSSGRRNVSDTKLSVSRSNNNMFGVHSRSHNRNTGRFSSPQSQIAGGLYNSQSGIAGGLSNPQSLTPGVRSPSQNRTGGVRSNSQLASNNMIQQSTFRFQSHFNNDEEQFSPLSNSPIVSMNSKFSDNLRQPTSQNSPQHHNQHNRQMNQIPQPQQQQKISDQELFHIQGIKMDNSYELYNALKDKSSSDLYQVKITEERLQDEGFLQQAENVLKNIFYQQIKSSWESYFYLEEQMNKHIKNSDNISLRPIKKYLETEFKEHFNKYFETKKDDLILNAINEVLKKQKEKSTQKLFKSFKLTTVSFRVLIKFLINTKELIDFVNFKNCFEREMKKEYSFATYFSHKQTDIMDQIKKQVKADFIKEANLNIKVQDSMKTKYSTLINKLAAYITEAKTFPVPIVNKPQASIEDFNRFYEKINSTVTFNSTNVIIEILKLKFKDIIVDFIKNTLLQHTNILEKNYIYNFIKKDVEPKEVLKILREMETTQNNKNNNFKNILDIIQRNQQNHQYKLIDFLNFYETITNEKSYIKNNKETDHHDDHHRQHESDSHSYTPVKPKDKSSQYQTNEKDKKKNMAISHKNGKFCNTSKRSTNRTKFNITITHTRSTRNCKWN